MRAYPPPQSGGYYTPWLWVDGRQRGSTYSNWATYVNQRLPVAADVQVNVTGTYEQATRSGSVNIEAVNSSMLPIDAVAHVVITEDSIYYNGPNGDPWHNHVCRDYVPDQNGTPVSIPGNGRDTLVVPFALAPGWNENRCNVVVYIQNPTTQPDSTKPVYNAGRAKVMSLVGINEPATRPSVRPALDCRPNPCRDRAEFRLCAPAGSHYRLTVYASDGSMAYETTGTASGEARLTWDAGRMPRGVYSCRLVTPAGSARGKLVLVN